jgi:hypothetical protein
MTDFSVRSDSVDVEEIMRQVRARVREKRGVDYTEEEIRELASVRLERFLDPSKVRSGLIEEFRRARQVSPPPENYDFEEHTLYASHRLPLLTRIRRLFNPVLKLFFNPNPLIRALHLQSKINQWQLAREPLDYEIMSNLVLEVTRLSIEVKNLKVRLESVATRLDFNEHRARALEGVVQYRPDAEAPEEPEAGAGAEGDEDARDERAAARKRRRRRGRRRPGAGGAGPGDAAAARGARAIPLDGAAPPPLDPARGDPQLVEGSAPGGTEAPSGDAGAAAEARGAGRPPRPPASATTPPEGRDEP